jgi:hypothetical protein
MHLSANTIMMIHVPAVCWILTHVMFGNGVTPYQKFIFDQVMIFVLLFQDYIAQRRKNIDSQ